MKIAVLGSTGMLGNAVGHYFDSDMHHNAFPVGYDAFLSYRDPKLAYGKKRFYFDAMDSRSLDSLPEVDYVINCIGCVKQQDHDIRTYMKVNAQFPHFLAAACERVGARLIHITTDCVFSGTRGNYHELDEPDCTDSYGISKELGEPRNCMVIRTSVIGEELRSHYSLLDWARSQEGEDVQGYVNHMWNGVTALQYAKICEEIISRDIWRPGLRHVFGETLSKYEMLRTIDSVYDLSLNISPYEHPEAVDRTLSTVYSLNELFGVPNFQKMVFDQRHFFKSVNLEQKS